MEVAQFCDKPQVTASILQFWVIPQPSNHESSDIDLGNIMLLQNHDIEKSWHFSLHKYKKKSDWRTNIQTYTIDKVEINFWSEKLIWAYTCVKQILLSFLDI